MEDVKEELELSQLLIELEQSHAQLYQMQNELEESELLRKQMQLEMEQMKSQLENTQEELGKTRSALHQTQGELDRYRYREAIASQIISEKEKEYKQLVWDAWSAYRSGNINQMVDCLQKSLKYTSLSRTKTVSNWVKSWSEFSQHKGEGFEVRHLNSYQEWTQLLRRMTRIKNSNIV
ncbi:MAG: hypothetical protein WBA93_14870 [Microcoleaceae cyanobacterium]